MFLSYYVTDNSYMSQTDVKNSLKLNHLLILISKNIF